ncbi:MAG: hypothetical protein ACP5O7_10970 [Phycisphaerae bacterium]
MHPILNNDVAAWRKQYRDDIEFLERLRAQELMNMTDARALEIIRSLVCAQPPWRERRDWSGLIEQQDLFHRRSKS